jgi:hypothetical protein
MQNFGTLQQPILSELSMSTEERGKKEEKMPFIVATYFLQPKGSSRTPLGPIEIRIN